MRDILFRAKGIDEDDKDRWYEGFYIALNDTTYCIKEDYEKHPDNTKYYIIFDQMTDWGLPNRHLQARINPDTLCQFTGIVAKDGRRIYEGDIVYMRCDGLSADMEPLNLTKESSTSTIPSVGGIIFSTITLSTE